jgi:hypothetical protein
MIMAKSKTEKSPKLAVKSCSSVSTSTTPSLASSSSHNTNGSAAAIMMRVPPRSVAWARRPVEIPVMRQNKKSMISSAVSSVANSMTTTTATTQTHSIWWPCVLYPSWQSAAKDSLMALHLDSHDSDKIKIQNCTTPVALKHLQKNMVPVKAAVGRRSYGHKGTLSTKAVCYYLGGSLSTSPSSSANSNGSAHQRKTFTAPAPLAEWNVVPLPMDPKHLVCLGGDGKDGRDLQDGNPIDVSKQQHVLSYRAAIPQILDDMEVWIKEQLQHPSSSSTNHKKFKAALAAMVDVFAVAMKEVCLLLDNGHAANNTMDPDCNLDLKERLESWKTLGDDCNAKLKLDGRKRKKEATKSTQKHKNARHGNAAEGDEEAPQECTPEWYAEWGTQTQTQTQRLSQNTKQTQSQSQFSQAKGLWMATATTTTSSSQHPAAGEGRTDSSPANANAKDTHSKGARPTNNDAEDTTGVSLDALAASKRTNNGARNDSRDQTHDNGVPNNNEATGASAESNASNKTMPMTEGGPTANTNDKAQHAPIAKRQGNESKQDHVRVVKAAEAEVASNAEPERHPNETTPVMRDDSSKVAAEQSHDVPKDESETLATEVGVAASGTVNQGSSEHEGEIPDSEAATARLGSQPVCMSKQKTSVPLPLAANDAVPFPFVAANMTENGHSLVGSSSTTHAPTIPNIPSPTTMERETNINEADSDGAAGLPLCDIQMNEPLGVAPSNSSSPASKRQGNSEIVLNASLLESGTSPAGKALVTEGTPIRVQVVDTASSVVPVEAAAPTDEEVVIATTPRIRRKLQDCDSSEQQQTLDMSNDTRGDDFGSVPAVTPATNRKLPREEEQDATLDKSAASASTTSDAASPLVLATCTDTPPKYSNDADVKEDSIMVAGAVTPSRSDKKKCQITAPPCGTGDEEDLHFSSKESLPNMDEPSCSVQTESERRASSVAETPERPAASFADESSLNHPATQSESEEANESEEKAVVAPPEHRDHNDDDLVMEEEDENDELERNMSANNDFMLFTQGDAFMSEEDDDDSTTCSDIDPTTKPEKALQLPPAATIVTEDATAEKQHEHASLAAEQANDETLGRKAAQGNLPSLTSLDKEMSGKQGGFSDTPISKTGQNLGVTLSPHSNCSMEQNNGKSDSTKHENEEWEGISLVEVHPDAGNNVSATQGIILEPFEDSDNDELSAGSMDDFSMMDDYEDMPLTQAF